MLRINRVFDFEVYPEWWCCCTREVKNPEVTTVVTSDDEDAVTTLRGYVIESRLIGFNIKDYDLLILRAILCGLPPMQVYEVSQDIIVTKKTTTWTRTFDHYRWHWLDLMNDWRFGSLKMFEANKGMAIVETSVPFGKRDLTKEEKDDIIKYCHADTWAEYILLRDRKDYFSIHKFVADNYDIPLQKAYQSTMGSLAALAMRAKRLSNVPPENKRDSIYVLDYIEKVLNANPFDYLLVDDTTGVYEYKGDRFYLGVGGVHSDYDQPIIAKTNDNFDLYSIDVTQYYPNMLYQFDLMPRGVPAEGVAIYENMIRQVELLKEEITEKIKNKEFDEAAKLTDKRDKYKVLINAVSGAMRNRWSKFNDPARIITMCAVGQFLLIAAVIDIKKEFPGTEILQTNTDGAYILVPKGSKFKEKVNAISKHIHFKFDVQLIDKLIQRDVNNYVALTGTRAKTKGGWIYDKRSEVKPASYAVSRRAVMNFLLYKTPIEKTIYECKEIMDFAACAKTGGTFDETIYQRDGVDYPANSTNRFIASKGYNAMLYKIKEGSPHKVANCPESCRLLNDEISTYKIEELNIDYEFYIKFAYDLIPNFYSI